jgi:hypothetical protein
MIFLIFNHFPKVEFFLKQLKKILFQKAQPMEKH